MLKLLIEEPALSDCCGKQAWFPLPLHFLARQIRFPGAANLAIRSSRFNICVFCSQEGADSFPWSVTFSREGPASVRRDLTPTDAPPMLVPRKTISQNFSQVWPPFLGDWRSVWVQVLDGIQKRPTEVSLTQDRGARRRDRAMGWEKEQMEVEKGRSYKERKCSMGIKGSGH